jgi:hypothetical protein
MTPGIEHNGPYRIDRSYPAIGRVLMAAIGLFCIITPAWDLRYALLEFGWWTIFFGVIVAGAWSIGFALLLSAVSGDSQVWTIENRTLRLERASPVRRRIDLIRAEDIASMEIRTIDWDSRPDTYSVVIHLRSGEQLETPACDTPEKADAMKARIGSLLGLT